MFVGQISLFIVTFLSLISQNLLLLQTINEVNPHLCIMSCVNMWSVTLFFFFIFFFFFLCHLLVHVYVISPGKVKWSGPHHTIKLWYFGLFHNVTCYTKYMVSHIHVNTRKLRNITCTLIATGVILRSLECIDVGGRCYWGPTSILLMKFWGYFVVSNFNLHWSIETGAGGVGVALFFTFDLEAILLTSKFKVVECSIRF